MNAFLRFLDRWLPYWKQPGATTIVFATAVHLTEAVVMMITTSANRSTPIAALIRNLPSIPNIPPEHSVALALFTVAILALVSMHGMALNHWIAMLLLLPQQALLVITCIGAIVETWYGTYADGYPAHPAFILCDQLTRILLAPAYTYAIFLRALWSPRGDYANDRKVVSG